MRKEDKYDKIVDYDNRNQHFYHWWMGLILKTGCNVWWLSFVSLEVQYTKTTKMSFRNFLKQTCFRCAYANMILIVAVYIYWQIFVCALRERTVSTFVLI